MESTHARRRLIALLALVLLAVALGGYAVWRRTLNPADVIPPDALRTDRNIVVEVENASGRRGLARQVTRLLRQRGIDVLDFSSVDSNRLITATEILVRRGSASHGQEVARVLGAGVVKPAPDSLRRPDITVRLGRDYVLPPGSPPF